MSSKLKILLACSLLIISCLALYGNTLHNEFVLDDYRYMSSQGNLLGQTYASLFTQGFKSNYRPLGFAFLKLEYHLFGKNLPGYHLTNIVLFGLVCCSFFYLALILFQDFAVALLASLLFCVHPINHFFVNYVSASMLILFVLFCQLSTILALKSLDNKKVSLYLLSLGCYFSSLFFHEISFILPLYIFIFFHFQKNLSWRRNLIFCLPYLFPFLLFYHLRLNIPDLRPVGTILFLDLPWENFLTTCMYLISWYLSKLLLPLNITFHISTDPLTHGFWMAVLLLLLSLSLFVYLLGWKWKRGILACSLALFGAGFIAFVPAAWTYYLAHKRALVETHWFGYSSMGFFLLLSFGLLNLKRKIPGQSWYFLVGILIIFFALCTRYYNQLWKNPETYFSYFLKIEPHNVNAPREIARAYLTKHHQGFSRKNYSSDDEIRKLINAALVLDLLELSKIYSSLLEN